MALNTIFIFHRYYHFSTLACRLVAANEDSQKKFVMSTAAKAKLSVSAKARWTKIKNPMPA